jgi:hypothetical protein
LFSFQAALIPDLRRAWNPTTISMFPVVAIVTAEQIVAVISSLASMEVAAGSDRVDA